MPRSAVTHLRALGHDVAYASEDHPSASDDDVWARAVREGRVLLTEDKGDFGFILRKQGAAPPPGIILIRKRKGVTPSIVADLVRDLFAAKQGEFLGHFTILMPDGRIRQSALAEAAEAPPAPAR